jgi:hypothetical protein
MALTASPFHPTTGELLPVYRDAYLRGDLSREHTALVDDYLKKNTALGTQTWQRFHTMQHTGEQVQAVGWMQRQLALAQSSPQRVRRQAATLAVGVALAAGAVFAGNAPTAAGEGNEASTEAAGAVRMTTVRGKILDENGRPLVGATVLEKGAFRGVSTNASGEYTLLVPAGRPTVLAYGYGGYSDEELQVSGTGKAVENVTLVPNYDAPKPARKSWRWFSLR